MEKKPSKLIPNSTQIPNIILDFIIPGIPSAETKCLLYICRRTYGFHKEKDRISLTQFVKGITSRADGEKLDNGTGLSRPSVVEALRNLTGSGLVISTKDKRGNSFELNCELLVDKYVEKGVVKKINQLRKLTRSSKESLPKQVKLLNPQKKGNKGKKVIIIDNKKREEKETKPLKTFKREKSKLVSKFEFSKV